MGLDVTMSANGNLYILLWCKTGSMKCAALDTMGPYTLVVEHVPTSAQDGSAAQPAMTNVVLKPATPMYDKFLAALDTEEASSLIQYIEQDLLLWQSVLCDPVRLPP